MMGDVAYNIVFEFVIPLKLGRFIKTHLNVTHNKVRTGRNLLTKFLFQIGLKYI
jgi:hypothetical protein